MSGTHTRKVPEAAIGPETQLTLYQLLVELRYCEKRAYDLFLQNLIKGTSHLALGQEAVAAGFGHAMEAGDYTFCTYRGHHHTLARGASMTGVLGELMGRSCGLLAGKGGGTIKTGRHVRYPRETPLNNLWLAMLERMGAPTAKLGDSTGRLQGLA